jgi:anti-repressor protein
MRDIKAIIEQLGNERPEIKFDLGYYTDSNNQIRPMYELTKKEALLLASGYDAVLRLKIIDKLEEFTNTKPRTHLEVLDSERALLIASEKTNALLLEANIKIESDMPKVVFADSVIGRL